LRAATAPAVGINGDLGVRGLTEVDRGWRDLCRSRRAAARKAAYRYRGGCRRASKGGRGTSHVQFIA